MSEEEKLEPQPVNDEETDDVPVDDLPGINGNAGPEDEMAQLDIEELKKKAAESDELRAKCLRAKADYDNLRKRSLKEQAQAASRGAGRLTEDLLPVLDDFERTLAAADAAHDFEQLMQGIRLVYQAFGDALAKHGVEPIEAKGEPFDHNLHEAVVAQPAPEVPDGTVIEEIRKGYCLGDRVIRHSQVVVAKNAGPDGENGSQPCEMGNGEESHEKDNED